MITGPGVPTGCQQCIFVDAVRCHGRLRSIQISTLVTLPGDQKGLPTMIGQFKMETSQWMGDSDWSSCPIHHTMDITLYYYRADERFSFT